MLNEHNAQMLLKELLIVSDHGLTPASDHDDRIKQIKNAAIKKHLSS
jgi:hypothetical protein